MNTNTIAVLRFFKQYWLNAEVIHSETSMEGTQVHDSVKDYYGKRLKTADDLQTQACVTVGKVVTKPVREAVAAVHDEVASKLVHVFHLYSCY